MGKSSVQSGQSERYIQLETSNIKGAEFVPVSIENKKGIRYNDYYAMIITGRASNADRKDSVAEYIENEHMWCDVGLLFPINSWDGTDIFYLEGSKASIILSEKAYNILSEYKEECFLRKCNEFIWPGKSKRCKTLEDSKNKNIIPSGNIE